MLSYRHAFHAGNHADVLKHLALLEMLRLLTRKEKGFLYVDTHAGAGAYLLDRGYAEQNREWESGVGRLRALPAPGPAAAYLAALDDFIAAEGQAAAYPGSPALAASVLRPQDRAVFFELHGADATLLAERFADDPLVRVRAEDGWTAPKALLPPPTRRGLLFLDPSYELAEDYGKVVAAAAEARKRFATGCVAVWYPLLERMEARELPGLLTGLGWDSWLDARLRVRAPADDGWGMSGSGLFIANPPYTLAQTLGETLPFLARVLGQNEGASWSLDRREKQA